jgi:adenine-specific DNA-methyltransferase
MNKLNTRKALNPAYRKHKPLRKEVNNFIEELKLCLEAIKISDENNESEEHLKEPIKNFFQNTFYSNNLINTKDRIDLAIYLDKTAKSEVGVLIEAKRPSNKSEFLTPDNLNRKALQELLLYYLRERLDNNNNSIKHLIATNGYEWFLFKAEDFYNKFFKNKSLIKEYEAFRDGRKDSTKNELFYNEIAKKYIAEVELTLPFVHLDFNKTNFDNLNDSHLNTLFKIFSNVHLLGHPFDNDSNQLNKAFYNELLHIIGLEEIKDKGKKLISRKPEDKRDYSSLLENTIFTLEDRDYLSKIKSVDNGEDKSFNAGLELCLTWINRILFLKLLESQLLSYHKGDNKYKFLNTKFIDGFDELNNLFFSALAKEESERHPRYKERFKYIPYLNSSLFERNELESESFEISALNDDEIQVYSSTVLKEPNGKRFKGKLYTLDYLFKFLESYDFSTDGTEGIEDDHETKTLINASVLGLIFEKINGYKEGSFYTPAYITMYMCRETLRRAVVQKFKEQENDQIETFDDLKAYCHCFFKPDDTKRLNGVINSLKICDPAVGSGHFLVSALNELIVIKNELKILVDAKGVPLQCDIEIVNDDLYILDLKALLFEYNPKVKESARIQHTLFHEKQILIENCLFGVDINPNSVKICRLRLWIELLKNAYYTSKGQLHTLPNIDINIKCGNSLISRFKLDDNLKDAFKGKDVKYNFTDYKKAVSEYKNTNSKERKREVIEIINKVKNNFTSTLDNKFLKRFDKAREKHNLKEEQLNNLKKFGEKITKADKDKLKELKDDVEKTYLQKEEIVNNAIFHNAFEWRFEFPEVLDDKGNYVGFDIIIGNPPYVQLSKISTTTLDEKNYLINRYGTSGGRLNTYIFFIHQSNLITNNNGFISYIIPNTILTQDYYKETRRLLLLDIKLYEVGYFDNLPFDDAVVETVIISYTKTKTDGFIEFIKFIENQFYFDKKTNNSKFIKDNSYRISYTLDDLTESIFEGDSIIRLNKIADINQGIALKGDKSLSIKKDNEDGNYYKVLDGRNINKYSIDWIDTYLDYSLERIHSCKTKTIFETKEKLFFRRVSAYLNFTYDNEQYFSLNTLVVVNLIADKNEHFLLKYLLTLLNSSLMQYVYKHKFKSTKTVFSEIQAKSVGLLPIKEIDIIKQKEFEMKADNILSLKKENPEADTTVLEQEIDQMVYKLYGLTEEEIKIVENS